MSSLRALHAPLSSSAGLASRAQELRGERRAGSAVEALSERAPRGEYVTFGKAAPAAGRWPVGGPPLAQCGAPWLEDSSRSTATPRSPKSPTD